MRWLVLVLLTTWSCVNMADVYVPVPSNNPTSITLPQDGDDKSAAVVREALAALADMAAHQGQRVDFDKRMTQTPTLLQTTSGTLTTLVDIPSDVALAAGDLVVGEISGWANCLATYKVDVYVSENGGADIAKTPEVRHAVSASGSDFDHLSLSFRHLVTTPGVLTVRIRGLSTGGAQQLSLYYTSLILFRKQ